MNLTLSPDRAQFSRWALTAAALLVWVALWFLPWQSGLESLARLRILIAVALFVTPGALLVRRLQPLREAGIAGILVMGLAVSIALTGILGLIANTAQLSIYFVLTGLFVVGALGLVDWMRNIAFPSAGSRTRSGRKIDWGALLTLGLAMVFAMRFFANYRVFSDDFWYDAVITHYANAPHLNFKDFFLGIDLQLPTRFWLAYWMLAEAVITRLANLHAVELTAIYLPPLLGVVVVLGFYALGRSLNFSPRMAALAVALEFASMLLLLERHQPGTWFLNRLVLDKLVAGFVVAPALWVSGIAYLAAPSRLRLLLVALITLGLMFTHPAIAGMACCVLGLYAALEAVTKREFKPFAALMVVFGIILAVPFALRFLQNRYASTLPFMLENIELDEAHAVRLWRLNDYLYGINPALLWGVPTLLALVAAVVALSELRTSRAARWVVAATVFVVLAVIPLTGWILGLGFTFVQLPRATWFLPFGIAIAFLLYWVGRKVQRFLPDKLRERPSYMHLFVSIVAVGIMLFSIVYATDQPKRMQSARISPRREAEILQRVEMGRQLDKRIADQAVVVGTDQESNWYLPALSDKANVIIFKSASITQGIAFISDMEAAQREQDWKKITDPSTERAERERLLDVYDVKFISGSDADTWLEQWAKEEPAKIREVARAGKYLLYQVLAP